MPKHLTPVARDKWKELVRLLAARGTLTKADSNALELYCETYAQWRLCLDEIAENGVMVDVTVTDSSGKNFTKRVQNPAQKMAIQLQNSLRQMLKEFAATPASREKAKPAKPPVKKSEEPEPGTVAWMLKYAEEEQAETPPPPHVDEFSDVETINTDVTCNTVTATPQTSEQ